MIATHRYVLRHPCGLYPFCLLCDRINQPYHAASAAHNSHVTRAINGHVTSNPVSCVSCAPTLTSALPHVKRDALHMQAALLHTSRATQAALLRIIHRSLDPRLCLGMPYPQRSGSHVPSEVSTAPLIRTSALPLRISV